MQGDNLLDHSNFPIMDMKFCLGQEVATAVSQLATEARQEAIVANNFIIVVYTCFVIFVGTMWLRLLRNWLLKHSTRQLLQTSKCEYCAYDCFLIAGNSYMCSTSGYGSTAGCNYCKQVS